MTRFAPASFARAALAAAVAAAPSVAAAFEPAALVEDARVDDVREALFVECYESGLTAEAVTDSVIVCGADLSGGPERAGEIAAAPARQGRARHNVRFTLADRAEGVRVWAYAWIDIEEPDGAVIEEEIVSDTYLRRVQDVLDDLAEAFGEDADAAAPSWSEHYETRDAWQLDAHLRAVDRCDRILDALSADELQSQLEAANVQPYGRDRRSRCEELHEEVFGWGLARGIDAPTVEDYADYLAALPPEQRKCSGRLALGAVCR